LRGGGTIALSFQSPTDKANKQHILHERREVKHLDILSPQRKNNNSLAPPPRVSQKEDGAPHVCKSSFASCLLELQIFALLCIYYRCHAYVLLHEQNGFRYWR
jgi:hypothetical protein